MSKSQMKSELKTARKTSKKSRLQLQYDSLVLEIEKKKTLKTDLENGLIKVSPLVRKELLPLIEKRTEAIRARIIRLDALADKFGVGKENTEAFALYLSGELLGVLKEKDFKDEIFVEMYRKYIGESPSTEKPPKQLNEYVANNQDLRADEFNWGEISNRNLKQEKVLARDSKSIYLRLVKKFHPDLEQDELLKIGKTAIVQEITKAYKNKDFFKLLDLQMEHFDPKEMDDEVFSEDMQKRYIKILTKQLEQLENEIVTLKQNSDSVFDDFFDHNLIFSKRKFKVFKKQIKVETESIQSNTRYSFSFEKEWFKDWVRAIRDN